MAFQSISKVHELTVKFWHFSRHFCNSLWGSDAGDDILALRIDQILAIHFIVTGAWISGESNARRTIISHVAKDHGDYVDGRAVSHIRGNIEFTPVIDRPFTHPGVEDGANRNL